MMPEEYRSPLSIPLYEQQFVKWNGFVRAYTYRAEDSRSNYFSFTTAKSGNLNVVPFPSTD